MRLGAAALGLLVCRGVSAAPADPFEWLEHGDAPAVERWTADENAAARKLLDGVPGRAALQRRLQSLYETGSLGVPVSRPHRAARRYFYTRRDGSQNQPVLYRRDGLSGVDRPLVDVNRERADGTRALDWWFPSDDGARVAYGVSDGGSEESTLRIRDVASGHDLPDRIARTRSCSLAWTPDGAAFYYTRYPAPGQVAPGDEAYHRSVFFHRLGDDPARDRAVFGAGRDRTDWPGVDLSPNGRWLVITVNQGWSKAELYLFDLEAGGPPVPIAVGEEATFEVVEALDDRLFVLTTSGAPRGRVVAIDPQEPARTRWRVILPEGEEVIESAVYFAGGLAAATLHDATARLRLFAADGAPRGDVALPSLGAITAVAGARDAAELFYAFTSFVSPTSVFHLRPTANGKDGKDGKDGDDRTDGTPWRELSAPVDPTHLEVERAMVISKDGTRLPLFLLRRRGVARAGPRPTLLTGYGGFAVSMQPWWTPSAIPFVESGGVYALAILRGGAEYGEAWHRAGMLGSKQNVFDDFIAASSWLIENRITPPDRLAISGGSNGGLLVGAALTQRPELYRAVVCSVPLLDMLRYHLYRIAALWVAEYGSPDDPVARRWLAAYSPYHHVRDGVRYPAVYLRTATEDTRVDPMHARKMAARLQAAAATVAHPNPVLLQVETEAGHGAGKPLAKVIAQLVDEWSFVFSELGVTYDGAEP